MPRLLFLVFAFLESKEREYSPFRNSFLAALRGAGRRKGGHQVPPAGNAWYCARIVARCTMHARIMALWRCMGLCTWNCGRGEGEAMRAHLLTVFSPFEHGSGLVFTLFAWPRIENGCNSNLKFCLRVHKEREVDMHSALGIGMAQCTQCTVHAGLSCFFGHSTGWVQASS